MVDPALVERVGRCKDEREVRLTPFEIFTGLNPVWFRVIQMPLLEFARTQKKKMKLQMQYLR